MSRYLSLVLAMVIIVIGLCLPQQSTDIKFGRSYGKSEKIESQQEFLAIVSSAIGLMNGETDTQYKSMSFRVESDQIIDLGHYETRFGEEVYISQDAVVNYKVNYCINEDGEMLVSLNANIFSEDGFWNRVESDILTVGVDIYYGKEATFLRIRDYYSSDILLSPIELSIYLNKWLLIDEKGITGIESDISISYVDMALAIFKDWLEYPQSTYKDNQALLTIYDKLEHELMLLDFCDKTELLYYMNRMEFKSSSFEFDMRNSKKPKVKLNCVADYSKVNKDNYYFGAENSVKFEMEFYNINNTRVNCNLKRWDIYALEDIQEILDNLGIRYE